MPSIAFTVFGNYVVMASQAVNYSYGASVGDVVLCATNKIHLLSDVSDAAVSK